MASSLGIEGRGFCAKEVAASKRIVNTYRIAVFDDTPPVRLAIQIVNRQLLTSSEFIGGIQLKAEQMSATKIKGPRIVLSSFVSTSSSL